VPEPLFLSLAGIAVLLVVVFWPWGGLFDRWRRRRARARGIRQQDALKLVRLDELEGRSTTMQTLGERLHLSAARATSTLDELEAAGQVTLREGEARLTPLGRAEASRIIRAHRLWERHLADDTGYGESEWHALAERQEHRLTAAEADALAQQLGQPARDPHGDPIPTADGEVILHEGRPLSELTAGTTARITHIEDEPAEVYEQILAAGLAPGAIVRQQIARQHPLAANGDEYRCHAAATAIAAWPFRRETPSAGRRCTRCAPASAGRSLRSRRAAAASNGGA
jgi:DtxR family Mn-dependent transcriptional regulator